MTGAMLLDCLAVRVDGPRAAVPGPVRLELRFRDTGSAHLVELSHGTLHHSARISGRTDAVVTLGRAELLRLSDDASALDELPGSGAVPVDGTIGPLRELLELLQQFDLFFPIVGP